MDSIKIDLGVKRIAINNDEKRVIEFNPQDIVFVERFYQLIKTFEAQEAEFQMRAKELEADTEKDEFGIPTNTPETLQLVSDLCDFLKEQIDLVFGSGASQTVFGDAKTMNMFEQFFSGITPFIQEARTEKVKKYVKKVPK